MTSEEIRQKAREAFESWCVNEMNADPENLERLTGGSGPYRLHNVNCWWMGWHAASLAESPAETPRDCCTCAGVQPEGAKKCALCGLRIGAAVPQPHHVGCSANPTSPIGSPGCVCKVVISAAAPSGGAQPLQRLHVFNKHAIDGWTEDASCLGWQQFSEALDELYGKEGGSHE